MAAIPNAGTNALRDPSQAINAGTSSLPFFGDPAQTEPYRVFIALISQTGTNPPTMVIKQNTLGIVPVFGYSAVGLYTLTANGYFPAGQVGCLLQNTVIDGSRVGIKRQTDNLIMISSFNNGGAAANDLLVNSMLEIRVWEK